MITVLDQTEFRTLLSLNMRRLRKDRGWNQLILAERVGITREHLNKIENGRVSPGPEILYAIADAFGVSTDALRQLCEKTSAA